MPLTTSKETTSLAPSLQAYRTYVNDPKNAGTFVSTSSTEVTTAPKTFFGHTLAFLLNKTNAQEVATLHESLETHFGPYVAQYAFPPLEREQAATSPLGGYVQQTLNTALTRALNPMLRNIQLDVSIPQNSENASPSLPFYQRQLRPIVQSAVKELNPALKGIKLDLSLPAEVPSIGVSHELVHQIIKRADNLVADAAYIKQAAITAEAITDSLTYLDENSAVALQDLQTLQVNISGLAEDIAIHQSSSAQIAPINNPELLALLKNTSIDIPDTIKNANSLLSETKVFTTLLQKLKAKHNYYELGSSAPIKLEAYHFEHFLEPATTLLQEEVTLATSVMKHVCSIPSSVNKIPNLEAHLKENTRIAHNVEKLSQQVSQLKEKLKTELKTLSDKAKKRSDQAAKAISIPSLLNSFRETLLLGRSWHEEYELAQEELDFATTTLQLIENAEEETAIPLVWKNIPGTYSFNTEDNKEVQPSAEEHLFREQSVSKANQHPGANKILSTASMKVIPLAEAELLSDPDK